MGNLVSKFLEKFEVLSGKMSSNRYLQGLSQGVMMALPIIIIGSLASLLTGLPVEAWQGFISSTGLKDAISALGNATTGMLGLYFTYGVTKRVAENIGVKNPAVPLLAIAAYLALLPSGAAQDGSVFLPYTYLGTQGMIVGIILAMLVPTFFKFVSDKNITIRMPDSVPAYVSNSFSALIPAVLVAVIVIAVRLLFTLTSFGDIFAFIYAILQAPLTMMVGQNIFSIVILMMIANLVFGFGIHSGFITSMVAPILFGLDGANQAAFAAGQPVPNTIGMAFNYSMTVAVFYPAMVIAILIAAKSSQLKTVSKVAILPSIFGISEPFVFGVPIVFNPVMLVPYILVPAINQIIGYVLIIAGIVPKFAGVTVFNFPMIITGLLNGSFRIAILEVLLLVLDVFLIIPFVKATDKQHLKEENGQED